MLTNTRLLVIPNVYSVVSNNSFYQILSDYDFMRLSLPGPRFGSFYQISLRFFFLPVSLLFSFVLFLRTGKISENKKLQHAFLRTSEAGTVVLLSNFTPILPRLIVLILVWFFVLSLYVPPLFIYLPNMITSFASASSCFALHCSFKDITSPFYITYAHYHSWFVHFNFKLKYSIPFFCLFRKKR